MTAEAEPASEPAAATPAVLAPAERMKVLLLGGVLVLLVNLSAPGLGLVGLPINFFLKNKLHLSAHGVAVFNLWTGVPLYISFVFGFVRDRWSPFGAGDRGHLALFGVLSASIYAAMAVLTPTLPVLLGGVLVVNMTLMMVGSATNGLMSTIGQQHVMAGQMSASFNTGVLVPIALASLLGGFLSQALEGNDAPAAARTLFLVAAGLMLAIALFGGRGPRALFSAAEKERSGLAIWHDILRLLKTWPVYPALLIQLLWQFGPAAGLVLQYHLANELHASDGQVGLFYAIWYISFIPAFFLYGWLCQRTSLGKLLFWGTVAAVPQMAPLLFVHSANGALLLAIPMGLMGGVANAAYLDLAIRSCPKALQGTMMMLIISTAYWVSARFGDLLGTDLYDRHGGFTTAVVVTIGVYALILPALLLVPRRLTSTADGEALAPAAPPILAPHGGP